MVVLLQILFAAALSQSPPAIQPEPVAHLSKQDLRAKLNGAHTKQDFTLLARYFESQALAFNELARGQKEAFDYSVAHPWIGTKYPSSSDRARILLSYFQMKERQARAEAYDYELKAANTIKEQ